MTALRSYTRIFYSIIIDGHSKFHVTNLAHHCLNVYSGCKTMDVTPFLPGLSKFYLLKISNLYLYIVTPN